MVPHHLRIKSSNDTHGFLWHCKSLLSYLNDCVGMSCLESHVGLVMSTQVPTVSTVFTLSLLPLLGTAQLNLLSSACDVYIVLKIS